jgi:tetratricopeptide (TPR) repeat protein
MATTPEAFQLALAHHRGGRLREAETIYRQILAGDPRHAQTLHMLGLLVHQAGRPDLAIAYLREATTIDPGQASFYNSLGEAWRSLGKLEDAQECFQQAVHKDADFAAAHYHLGLVHEARGHLPAAQAAFDQVLRLNPRHADTHNSLGNLLRQQGDATAALRHYRKAIECRGDFAEAHNNLGNVLQDLGQFPEAIASFKHALRLRPETAQIHFNLGNAWRDHGSNERALASYRQALRCAPDFAPAHNNLGTLLQALGDREAAERAVAEAARIDPAYAEAQYNLGTLRQKRGDLAGAEAFFLRAIKLNPDHAEAHLNLGMTWQAQNRWTEARDCYLEALRIRPRYVEPLCNLGILRLAVGADAEALAYFNQALEIQPDFVEAHYNRGVLLLGQDNYEAGWDDFAWHVKHGSQAEKFDQPFWDGSPLEGRTIFVHCDHGLGDTLHFVRYLPQVHQRGAGKILLGAQVALHPLLRQSGVGELVAPDAPSLEFDVHVPVVGLPCVFRTSAETIPAGVPYLQADADLVQQWRDKLARLDGFKIGIGWQGNRRYTWDHLRSIPLAEFEPLARTPGTRLISLQQGEGREQVQSVADRFEVVDLGDQVDRRAGAFVDTAAILKNLDLVITSDTALAHLAGALALPVWVALSFAPEWRWGRRAPTSPWYPTMRLFRQTVCGDWSEPFERIAAELRQVTLQGQPADKKTSR